ncbi:MAG: shikimate kinase [Clostridia bacterium]|nr:shikimate kinase [Clostridia bacterium]
MKYCLMGEKLGHSYSREIHVKMGLEYDLVEVPKTDLEKFFKTTKYNGFNITAPYKIEALKYVTNLTPVAKSIGSINAVKNVNGVLYGDNTDAEGMRYMIKRKGVSLKDKCVMILGSGGTSKTATTVCALEGAKKVTVVSRTGDVNYQNCYDLLDTEVIIHATPVGTYPNVDGKVIDLSKFTNLIAVFDCVYNPFKTDLIMQAESLGLICSSGLPMLVKQALVAEEFWLGVTINDDKTEEIISKVHTEKTNIVLYGMSSAGKTTVGKMVAEKLNRDFIDTDVLIENRYKKTPSQIITEQGEDEFRRIESEIVSEVAKLSGKVISLGGGAVLRAENQTAIKRNSVLALITRDINLLTCVDRPIAKSVGIKQLYESRKDLYDTLKDFEILNNGDVLSAVTGVIKGYENTCDKRC